jgi:hypothetical protein
MTSFVCNAFVLHTDIYHSLVFGYFKEGEFVVRSPRLSDHPLYPTQRNDDEWLISTMFDEYLKIKPRFSLPTKTLAFAQFVRV